MRWREPSRPEGQLWNGEFNGAYSALAGSGFTDEDAAARALFALGALLDAELECADLVVGLVVAILFQASDALAPERLLEAADLGLRADRTRIDDDPERPWQRAVLRASSGQAHLALHAPFKAIEFLGEERPSPPEANGPSADAAITSFLAAGSEVVRGVAWDAVLEPARAREHYGSAYDLIGPFIDEDDQLVRLAVDLTSFLYGDTALSGDDAGDEVALASLRATWQKVATIRVTSAVGVARCQAMLGDPGSAESTRLAADAVGRVGPGSTHPLLLVPIVRNVASDVASGLIEQVIDQSEALQVDADPYRAVLYAVGAAKVAQESGDDSTRYLEDARAAAGRVDDDLVRAATAGWTAVAEHHAAVGAPEVEQSEERFLELMERVEAGFDPLLRDLRLRAAFDEPLAQSLAHVARRFARSDDSTTRTHLARLIDGLWDSRPPFETLLRGADSIEAIEGGVHAVDRLGRLEAALEDWPEAAVVIERELGSEILFIGACAHEPTLVAHADAAWREAAHALAAELQKQVDDLELVGVAGSGEAFEPLGQAAFSALPEPLRELLSSQETILVCPDYRTNGDSVPYELLHDCSGWLGLTKVVARYPSLGALTRSLEGTTRRSHKRRALAVAVPHVPKFDDLVHATEESAMVQALLTETGWDAPEIASDRVTSSFLLDRLPFIAHAHVAAHGDASGYDEAIVLAGGERLRTDDLLSRFFAQVPTVYLNTCSLASTRYAGAGVTKGVALALAERGAAAVVANLLPVDDEASSRMARTFYETFAPFGDAVRLARSTLASAGVSPLFWGTCVLIGDPRTTLVPSRPPPTPAERFLDHYFAHPGEGDDDQVDEIRLLAATLDDPRMQAAAALAREVAAWPEGGPTEHGRIGAALRLALELDHHPAAAWMAYLLADGIDDLADPDVAARALDECLSLIEPLEGEGYPWKPMLDQLLVRREQVRLGSRRLAPQVVGGDVDDEQELLDIGRAIFDAKLAIESRAVRAGYAPQPREEDEPADVLWNAVLSGRELDLDDERSVAAYAQVVVQRLVQMDALPDAAEPLARTAIGGFLLWLWSRQHATDLPSDMAEGQAGTLGELVKSIGSHWPPSPAPWFEAVEGFDERTKAALAALEGLPYDDRLYPRIDEAVAGIAEDADQLLTQVRNDAPDRLPDAASWVLGVLVDVNTYSPLDGSVPEDIGERLRGVYTQLAFPGDDLFMPWLMDGFEAVRNRGVDELERWRYGLDGLDDLDEDDEDLDDGDDGGNVVDPLDNPSPRLPREEREVLLRNLLDEAGDGTLDGLPEGLLDLVTDEGDLVVLEEALDPGSNRIVLRNAVRAIGLLADGEWTGQVLSSPDTSVPPLLAVYTSARSRALRLEVIQTLFRFDTPELPIDFLVDRLEADHVALKSAILADLQFVLDRPYLADVVTDRVLPMLHDFCELPLRECMYADELFGEMDFRFWVFRCLRGIGSQESVPVIERYLDEEADESPLDAVAEAVHAHWALTHRLDYLPLLRKAKEHDALGNTEHALEEMEAAAMVQPD